MIEVGAERGDAHEAKAGKLVSTTRGEEGEVKVPGDIQDRRAARVWSPGQGRGRGGERGIGMEGMANGRRVVEVMRTRR